MDKVLSQAVAVRGNTRGGARWGVRTTPKDPLPRTRDFRYLRLAGASEDGIGQREGKVRSQFGLLAVLVFILSYILASKHLRLNVIHGGFSALGALRSNVTQLTHFYICT